MMIKKILLILLLILSSCGKKENNLEFIDPVRDVFVYGELDKQTQDRIRLANGNREYKNYQFKMLNKDVFDKDLLDINGNSINLNKYKDLAFEVVSVTCNHCRNQLKYIGDFVSKFDGTFIQYFNVGNKQEILDLYGSENIKIPDNLIIISKDDAVDDYIRNYLDLEMYPTLICFKNGKVSFSVDGEVELEYYDQLLDIAFKNTLKEEELKDQNGISIFKLNRSIEDVKNDLSSKNQMRINDLDNDGKTIDLTYNLMGKALDFDNMQDTNNSIYINEVDDFNKYKDKQLVLLYTSLRNKNAVEEADFINELISVDDKVEYLVVLNEDIESSSKIIKDLNISFKCPVVSLLSDVLSDFNSFAIYNYPTAVFVSNSVFTGAYSNIKNKEKFLDAIKMFLSDESIAYKNNN